MNLWKELAREMEDRLDTELLPLVYSTLSVSSKQIREELSELGLGVLDEAEVEDLDPLAAEIIARSVRRFSLVGAMGGLGGIATIPPEIIATLIASLRLCQRLEVLYGFDPDSEHGRLLLWRAMGAAYGVKMPKKGSLRVPGVFTPKTASAPDTGEITAWMTRQIVQSSIRSLTRRFSRWIPGLGLGFSVAFARRQMKKQGREMQSVFRAAYEGRPLDAEAAIEVEELD